MASFTLAVSQLNSVCSSFPTSLKCSNHTEKMTCYFNGNFASPLKLRSSLFTNSLNAHKQTPVLNSKRKTQNRFCVRNDLEEPVTIDNGTVLVVGGGGLGMETLRPLAKKGSWVTAFHRGEKFRKEIEGLGSFLAIGDVLKPETLDKVFRTNTFDAVVCTVGGGISNILVDSEGAINVIKAAEKAKVPRFVLVTSIGTGDSAAAIPEKEMQILKPVLEAKLVAEEYLKKSEIKKWTVIRPGGLLSSEATGTGFLTEDNSIVGLISRAEVANLILNILFNEDTNGKTLSVLDQVQVQEKEKIKKFELA